MRIAKTIADVPAPDPAKRRALVPTMGALHKAHGELIRVAREKAGKDGEVVVSIFVNPLQFEPGSDYERYPRPEKEDEEFCRKLGVDLLFRPAAEGMYVGIGSTLVIEAKLSIGLEGRSRPGHFPGVCTVVAKLFNILQPDAAVFGEKDFQQLAIIRRMVRDLSYKIDIVAVPTVREDDGLAFSSRNRYLNAEERKQAAIIRKALVIGKASTKLFGSRTDLLHFVRETIASAPLARIDYVDLVDAETLEPIESVKPNSLLAVAVYFGKTRLIDNILLG
jgi:pantoate--beta-alanine ligase